MPETMNISFGHLYDLTVVHTAIIKPFTFSVMAIGHWKKERMKKILCQLHNCTYSFIRCTLFSVAIVSFGKLIVPECVMVFLKWILCDARRAITDQTHSKCWCHSRRYKVAEQWQKNGCRIHHLTLWTPI